MNAQLHNAQNCQGKETETPKLRKTWGGVVFVDT